jgi:hypothetical protein
MKRLWFVLMCLCLVSPLFAVNLLVNPGFETGTTEGWGPRFGAGAIQVITSNPSPRTGNYCVRDYNRTATWHGIWQSTNWVGKLTPGQIYPASAWVRTNTNEKVTVALTMQENGGNPTPRYINVGTVQADKAQWYLVSGTYTCPSDPTEITFYIEAPGSATCEIYVDDAALGQDDEVLGLPYDPQAAPENVDGTAGTPVEVSPGVYTIDDIVLSFKAGRDLTGANQVNPGIHHHNVYLQYGLPNDANMLLVNYSLPQVSLSDPLQSFALADVVPPIKLKQGTTYKWQVEMVMKDPNGIPYPANSPENIWGSVWSFTTANAVPAITAISDHMLLVDGGTSFTITATNIANNYRWFKVVGNPDTAANGETDDIMLTNTGIYSGTTTKTLVITGAAANGSDDARVYAKAYNGIPGEATTQVSAPSAARWFWAPRLMNLYAFNTVNVVDGVQVTPDLINGYDMKLLSNDTGTDVPSLDAGLPPAPGIAGNASSLKFHNPRSSPADPNNGDAQYAAVSQGWAGAYKDITISAWVYNSGGSNWNRILDYGNDTNNYMMLCVNPGSVNNAVRFAVKVAGTEQTVTTADQAAPVGQWTHVVATLTGSTARIYINGELVVTSTSITNDPITYGPSVNNWIGRSQWGSGDGYFNGKIDQLKIYNYALSTVQIGQDYLADTLKDYVCNRLIYDLGNYDTNGNCLLDLYDFASMAARWLEDDRIYPAK